MHKTITFFDIQHYLQEINQLEKGETGHMAHFNGPSNLTLQNIFRYSRALNILKTSKAGTIFQLVN
jgi:hypothetical protein